jgi:hypothetical protein
MLQQAIAEGRDITAPYGRRPDGTPKGAGFLGEIQTADGGVMTENRIGVNLDGEETLIPLIVPTLTAKEVSLLAAGVRKTSPVSKLKKSLLVRGSLLAIKA